MMYDRITEGQDFIPSAKRENAINDLLNQISAPSGSADRNTYSARQITVPVKLTHADTVAAGKLIAYHYQEKESREYALSVADKDWQDTVCRYGITKTPIQKGEIADIVANGPARIRVNMLNAHHRYAIMDSGGALHSCGFRTQFQILSVNDEADLKEDPNPWCWVYVGEPAGGTFEDKYYGPFMVTTEEKDGKLLVNVSGGLLNRNGVVTQVGAVTLEWKDGYICVQSSASSQGWSVPKIAYGSPGQFSYPVAYLYSERMPYDAAGHPLTADELRELEELQLQDAITWKTIRRVSQYHVPMAFIISSKNCPVAGAFQKGK